MNHRWLKLRTGLFWLVSVLAVFLLIQVGIYIHDRPPACVLPCRDLGSELELTVPAVRPGGRTEFYRPRCGPIELTLELDKPEARVNQRYTLWYRAGIKNICCQSVAAKLLFFVGNSPFENGFSFRVWDPAGRLVVPATPYPTVGSIIAYREDRQANQKLAKGLDRWGYSDLASGEMILSNPSIFAPTEIERGGESLEDLLRRFPDPSSQAFHKKAIRERDERTRRVVAGMNLPAPPRGYRVLMEYLFNKPGTYRIQAVYDEQALIAPKPTWLESWPEPSRSIVGISLDIFDRFPFSGDARWYGIHAESAILDFEVKE